MSKSMNEEQMYERFKKVTLDAMSKGKSYTLVLSPLQVTTMHGAIVLVLKHPQIRQLNEATKILAEIRKALLLAFRDMGFTEEETRYLDTRDVGIAAEG